jgi:hypothetical protein
MLRKLAALVVATALAMVGSTLLATEASANVPNLCNAAGITIGVQANIGSPNQWDRLLDPGGCTSDFGWPSAASVYLGVGYHMCAVGPGGAANDYYPMPGHADHAPFPNELRQGKWQVRVELDSAPHRAC